MSDDGDDDGDDDCWQWKSWTVRTVSEKPPRRVARMLKGLAEAL